MMQLREHPGVVSKREWYTVDPRMLMVVPDFNVRDLSAPTARSSLDELKESIRQHGVQDPLEIRIVDETLIISSGHRRHKAVMELIDEGMDIRAIPVVPEPKGLSEADRFVRAMHVLNDSEPLTVLEKAEMVRRLLNVYGWTKEQVATHIGVKTVRMVDNYLEAAALPEEIKEAVREGDLSVTTAVEIVRNVGPTEAPATLRKAKETAAAKGKTKVTAQSVERSPKKKGKGKHKGSRNIPNTPRGTYDPDYGKNGVPPSQAAQMGNVAKVNSSLRMLREAIADNYDPERAAENMPEEKAFDLILVGNWFSELVRLVQAREAAAA